MEVEEKERSLQEIVDAVKEALAANAGRQEITRLKSLFYRTQEQLVQTSREQFVAQGGKEEDFAISFTEENELKTLLEEYKIRRAAELKEEDAHQRRAAEMKRELLAQLHAIVESLNTQPVDFISIKDIQQKWKACGETSQHDNVELLKQYQQEMEQFYDYVKVNQEMRDYDFKKNLEEKEKLCLAAEALIDSKNPNEAFQKLQLLHAQWKETGPVAKEIRETVWQRFKTASEQVNKNHATYNMQKTATERANLAKKTALCETIEAIDYAKANSYKAWEAITAQVLDLQQQWKEIGFAPKKDNSKIYERFRRACDALFAAKSTYYKETKSVLSENLARKKALCQQAEALKDSNDWKKATEAIKQLQKEWKTIGAVPHKLSDDLWKRFTTACDAFFARRQEAHAAEEKKEKGIESLRRDRDRLQRAYDKLKQDLNTRENNISFFRVSSKGANPLLASMEQAMEQQRKEMAELLVKIKKVEEEMRNA